VLIIELEGIDGLEIAGAIDGAIVGRGVELVACVTPNTGLGLGGCCDPSGGLGIILILVLNVRNPKKA
jgi:hypothetical protein